MRSSRGITTGVMLARGLEFEYGSAKERLIRIAIERERQIEYLKTVSLVNAIIGVGNLVAAAVTESPGNQLGDDKLTKALELLKDLLIPEEGEQTSEKAKEAKAKLAAEIEKGPLKVRPIGVGKKRQRKKQ